MEFGSSYVYVGDNNKKAVASAVSAPVQAQELSAAQNRPSPAPAPAPAAASSSSPSPSSAGLGVIWDSVTGWFKSSPDASSLSSSALPKQGEPEIPQPQSQSASKSANTNVLSINLGVLGDNAKLLTGDPIFCGQCKAVFNSLSFENWKSQNPKESSDFLEKKTANAEIKWRCEFCDHANEFVLNHAEIPIEDTLDYLLEPAQLSDTEPNIVFCIDTSGSMCQTSEMFNDRNSKKFAFRGNAASEKMKQFNDDNSQQFLPGERRDVTYISRLQCAQTAIESQLDNLQRTQPRAKVGLITFNNEVTVIGDGSQQPVHITGEKLSDYDQLLELGKKAQIGKSIGQAKENLVKRIHELEESGATALGPAIVVALAMAAGAPGSKLIVATDGLANVGVGDLTNENAAREFYGKVTQLAKASDVSVSVISIKGQDCNLSLLGELAGQTQGDVQSIDALTLSENFANILSAEFLARKCSATVLLHRGLRFTIEEAEEEKEVSPNNPSASNVLKKEIGNVFRSSEVTFEFEVRPKSEFDFPLESIKSLPFQVQIVYTKPNGMRCIRSITKSKAVTADKTEAMAKLNYKVLAVNATYQSAKLAQQGLFDDAIGLNVANENLMRQAAHISEENAKQVDTLETMVEHTHSFNKQISTEADKKKRSSFFSGFTFGLGSSGSPAPAASASAPASNPSYQMTDSTAAMIYQYQSSAVNPLYNNFKKS